MENYKVKWLVADKRLIKFVDVDDSYNIAEGINLEGVEPKVDVKVEIKDNVVVSLTVGKGKAKAEDKPAETEPQDCPDEKAETKKEEKVPINKEEAPAKVEKKIDPVTWTISAISFDNAVVKFAEQKSEKYWYPIADKAIGIFKGLQKDDKVQIVIDTVDAESRAGEAYTKDGIVDAKAIVKKEEEKTVEEKKDTFEDKKSTDTQSQKPSKRILDSTGDSIERQVALKEACAMARCLIEADKAKESLEHLIPELTKICLNALRNA